MIRVSTSVVFIEGFPEWLINKTSLEHHYQGVSFLINKLVSELLNKLFRFYKIKINSNTWMENIVELLSWGFMEKLTNWRMNNDFEWGTSPTNVNAFHTFQANAISKFQ